MLQERAYCCSQCTIPASTVLQWCNQPSLYPVGDMHRLMKGLEVWIGPALRSALLIWLRRRATSTLKGWVPHGTCSSDLIRMWNLYNFLHEWRLMRIATSVVCNRDCTCTFNWLACGEFQSHSFFFIHIILHSEAWTWLSMPMQSLTWDRVVWAHKHTLHNYTWMAWRIES